MALLSVQWRHYPLDCFRWSCHGNARRHGGHAVPVDNDVRLGTGIVESWISYSSWGRLPVPLSAWCTHVLALLFLVRHSFRLAGQPWSCSDGSTVISWQFTTHTHTHTHTHTYIYSWHSTYSRVCCIRQPFMRPRLILRCLIFSTCSCCVDLSSFVDDRLRISTSDVVQLASVRLSFRPVSVASAGQSLLFFSLRSFIQRSSFEALKMVTGSERGGYEWLCESTARCLAIWRSPFQLRHFVLSSIPLSNCMFRKIWLMYIYIYIYINIYILTMRNRNASLRWCYWINYWQYDMTMTLPVEWVMWLSIYSLSVKSIGTRSVSQEYIAGACLYVS